MALNYAEQWSPELLEILMQGTLTSPFVTSNVRWLDAKTFHFTHMSTSGYKNHSREGGWNKGTYTQTDVPYTLTHEQKVQYAPDARCRGVFIKCQARHCEKVFEIILGK